MTAPLLARARDRATVLAFRLGWLLLRLLPERLAYRLFEVVADVVTRRDGTGVQRLRRNYARVRPDLDGAALEDVVAKGVRATLRYYLEAFRLPATSGARVDAAVTHEGAPFDRLEAELRAGRPVLVFLGHTGNWDLAGAWCARHLGHVVTVAERLQPEEMFQAFLDFREGELGMTIHPAEHGTLDRLRDQLATGEPVVMPLLADRDLSASGIEVDLRGHRARMAAGPALLAAETGLPLFPVTFRHERGADGRWGMVMTFHEEIQVDPPGAAERARVITEITQHCADALGEAIAAHPQDWHMMQKVFLADLDPARDAARRAGDGAADPHGQATGTPGTSVA